MVHSSQFILLRWQLFKSVAWPTYLVSVPHKPASKSLFPNQNFAGTPKTPPINILLVDNFPVSKIHTQMVSLYKQIDFHNFQVFSVCSVAPLYMTSTVLFPDFLSFVLVFKVRQPGVPLHIQWRWWDLVWCCLINPSLFIACVNSFTNSLTWIPTSVLSPHT